jgi:hypothetical protein
MVLFHAGFLWAIGCATVALVLRIEPLFGVSTKGFDRLSQKGLLSSANRASDGLFRGWVNRWRETQTGATSGVRSKRHPSPKGRAGIDGGRFTLASDGQVADILVPQRLRSDEWLQRP